MSETCETCGAIIAVGDWPLCPHGKGVNNVVQDSVPGGFTVENGFETPQTFYSKSAHRKALDARGLMIGAKPTRRESFADPYTMAAATALVSRAASIASTAPDPSLDVPVEFFERVLPDMLLRVKADP